MRIIRLGKNGMVRSQKGMWFNANHFVNFYIDHNLGKWLIVAETQNETQFILGVFSVQEEAQAELDSLFGEDEART